MTGKMRYLNSKCHGGSNMPFNLHSRVSAMKTKKITYKILYNEQKCNHVIKSCLNIVFDDKPFDNNPIISHYPNYY